MGDKANKRASGVAWTNKPVPMKFISWETNDKTPPNCIPRLCTVTINRLVLLKPYVSDLNSLMVAVKMQNSKRTLRSNEISIANSSTESSTDEVEIELDLTFALQYSHFLKQEKGNQLQILLQRKKRYKNRAILGCKTLAIGVINMAEVLQRSNYMEKQLELRDNTKDIRKSDSTVARIYMSTLKSQPVDHEGLANGRQKTSLNQSAEGDSEDDIDDFSQSEGSDSEALDENGESGGGLRTKYRKRRTKPSLGAESLENPSQRNLKQKFIALLKKFRIPDSEASDSEEHYRAALEKEFIEAAVDEQIDNDEDDIFDFDSDSTQEFDGFSISSTPRPGLKPFFSSKTTLVGPDSDDRDKQQALRRLDSENMDKNMDLSSDKDFTTASSSPKPSLRPFFSSKGLSGHGLDMDINESGRCEAEPQDSSGTEQTPDTSDTSLKHTFSLDETGKQRLDKEKKLKASNKASSVMSGGKNVKDTLTRLLRK